MARKKSSLAPAPPPAEFPGLAIVLVTYKRLENAIRTIQSTCENLDYPQDKIKWFIGDDGSGPEYMEALRAELAKHTEVWWESTERLRKEGQEESYFCGKVWNLTLGNAHQYSDFVLWLEDDWVLDEPLEMARYVNLLRRRVEVGAVSFRILSIDTDVKTRGEDGRMFVEYLRTSQYAYSGNPILRHARFVRHYGWFDEEKDPGGVELNYDDKYRLDEKSGPTIWRPLDISPWGAWKHIGTDKTWK